MLVITSTWRHGCTLAQLRADFARVGCQGRIVGKTPDLPDEPRGNEIERWLWRGWGFDIAAFVILDDDNDMGALRPELIQTNGATGLTDADTDRALTVLGQRL